MIPDNKKVWFINKTFIILLLIIIGFILGFMASWVYHQSDYVRTGCDQFKKAGFHHVTREDPRYSYQLDPDYDGTDCN